MGNTRREIISGQVYEICFRAKEGLPLPPSRLINQLIKSIVARTQRDEKVTLCHHNWLANHPHMIVRTRDADQATKFYGEIKKRITDAIKVLLRIEQLNLWEDRCLCTRILDIEKVKDRIAYLYANPAAADLEETIDRYPGVSSWKDYIEDLTNLEATHTTKHPWIQLPYLEQLPSTQLSDTQDKNFTKKFCAQAKVFHSLVCKPNDWMKAFRISDPSEVRKINEAIIADVRQREKECVERRSIAGKGVVKAHRLRAQPIMKSHQPKTKGRKIFVLCSDKAARISYIQSFKAMCGRLRDIYQEWRSGDFSRSWPPGWFKPRVPILANSIA